MPWVSPPTHSAGDVLSASDWNTFANDLIWETNHAGLYGAAAAYSGSFPGNPGLLISAGSVLTVPPMGPSGEFSVSFPLAFPNGVLSLQLTPGDQAVIGQMSLSVQGGVVSTTGFSGQAFQATGGISGATIRVNYVALGF